MGPQGSGKGTQAKLLAAELKLCHISTGDLLRGAKGALKEEIDLCINAGKLVSDELMLRILKEKLNQKECKKGFILDGFPRNIAQAKALDSITKIDKVIEIYIPDDLSVKRISSRLSCPKCGAVFNTESNRPKKESICDACGSKLIKRADDTEAAIRKRLEVYHKETEKILSYYPANLIVRVDSSQEIRKTKEEILKALK